MPIISTIGSRSLKTRMVYGLIFAVLSLGALSMIYPFLLMLAGSVKSEADFYQIVPVPRYLRDDDALWPKYVESRYRTVTVAEMHLGRQIGSWRLLETPQFTERERALAEQYRAFRSQYDFPFYWFTLAHADSERILAKNGREFRAYVQKIYNRDLSAYRAATGVNSRSWSNVRLPLIVMETQFFNFPRNKLLEHYYDFKEQAPRHDWRVVDLDGLFWQFCLLPRWPTIEHYNRDHGTSFTDYREVVLARTAPPAGLEREDWDTFIKDVVNPVFVRIDDSARGGFALFLQERFGSIDNLNKLWETRHTAFESVPFPDPVAGSESMRNSLVAFLKDRRFCPLEALSIDGPRQAFEAYLAQTSGAGVDQIGPARPPIEVVDYLDMLDQRTELRFEFIRRNYLAVLDYILLHGNGVRNTIIYCGLMIGATLLVNPLAAYALSRYRPPTMYTILLFCMCTMAFPAEVTMIPAFLLLKKFPLYALFLGFAAAIATAMLIRKWLPHKSEWLAVFGGTFAGILAGYWLAPLVAVKLLGRPDATVSLLNTFWALVLPGMANGFSIFLLKGFFDSLPRELYEAADIDGASEWTKFWTITMSLSKPILAVLALNAFTAAYSEFMMALVIIPDQDMWTIMVWLFQLQSNSHPSVVYASLVIAAIPTLLIFMFCQNLIMRGIVVPVEK